MKALFTILAWITLSLGIASPGRAQTEIPKPAPEFNKLNYFAGVWTAEGEMKPGTMGSAGKFTGTNRVEWMEGAILSVARLRIQRRYGERYGNRLHGLRQRRQDVHVRFFQLAGRSGPCQRHVERSYMDLAEQDKDQGSQTMKARLTIKVRSPKAYDFKFEMSPDGTTDYRAGR